MRVVDISLAETGQMHPLTRDYLLGDPSVKDFYEWPLSFEGIKAALEARKAVPVDRQLLTDTLRRQYEEMQPGFFGKDKNAAVARNIESLKESNTFTITTGHQLNIFTGPLYFIYKLISAIKYAGQLRQQFPGFQFVPLYWMATEDHDFEEINHIHLWGKSLSWEKDSGGPTGKLNPKEMAPLVQQLKEMLGDRGAELGNLLEKAYLGHDTLAQATRSLVHELLGEYGIVIMDADDAALKRSFIPVFQYDIIRQIFEKRIQQSMQALSAYKLPVNPRAINVFYFDQGGRYRIVDEGGYFQMKETGKKWTVDEILAELEAHPERFSPNVVLRPMYQEVILPNLAYIGGTNEIAYWLELKSAFETAHIFFPQLVVRDSATWMGKKAAKELESLGLEAKDLFLGLKELKDRFYELQQLEHPSEARLEKMMAEYEELKNELQSLSPAFVSTLVKSINAQQKELKKWKGDIHKQQMEQEEKQIQKLEKLHQFIFPESELQERHDNFIPLYLQYGSAFFSQLIESFDPLKGSMHFFMEN